MTREGTLVTIDGRPALRFERRYRHGIERVWRAVTDPAEMAQWFPSQVHGERAVGAELVFDDDDQRAAAREAGEPTRDDGPWFHGRVVTFDPPHVFAFTWGGEFLRLELTADGDETVLVFTQLLGHRSTAARNGAGWHACLGGLDVLLGAPPAAEADWPAVYADYLRRMGPPLATVGPAGALTWEMATHQPPERVERAVHDADEIAGWGGTERVAADAPRWDVEPVEHGTVYRLTVDGIAGDAERAAAWHALLVQLDMWLAAGQLVPADPAVWRAAYATR